ncbi:MAG TPA: PAS domain S-box protein [Deltaproteobacteria bacterium]|nr:PAS domain S-box protein [Deltaproteobacteria bacterium]
MNEEPTREELAKRIEELEQERLLIKESVRESEERYQALYNRSFDMVYTHDFNGRFIDANDVALDAIGYSREDLPTLTMDFLLSEDQAQLVAQTFQELRETGSQKDPNEFRLRCRDGGFIWLETKSSVIYRGGQPYAVQGIARDITKWKMNMDRLRKSEEHYRTVFENTGTASIIIGSDTTIRQANANFEKLSGFSKQELEGKLSWMIFIAEDDLERMKDFHEQRREESGSAPNSYEFRFRNRSGGIRDILLTIALISGTTESIGSLMDITERKRAEEGLRRSEERYRDILESMEEAYFEVDLKGNFTFFNATAVTNLGYTDDEMMGMNFHQYVNKENAHKVFESFHKVYVTGEPIKGFDWEIIKKKGEKMDVESSVALRRDADGTITGFKGVVRDISKRKQAEEALRESEQKYRSILESIEEAYFEVDLKGDFTFFNGALSRCFGYDRQELIGMNNRAYTTPETARLAYQIFSEIHRTGLPRSLVNYEIIRKDGSKRILEMSISLRQGPLGEPIGFRGVARDVTERIRSEQALRESERRYRTIFEKTATANVIVAEDNTILLANSNFEKLSCLSRQKVEGKMKWTQLVDPGDLERMKQYHAKRRLGQGSAPESYEFTSVGLYGGKRDLFLSVAVIPETKESIASIMDITKRKGAEKALRESEERFRDLAELLPETVFETDAAGRFTFVNRSAFEQFGYEPRDLARGLTIFDVLAAEDHLRAKESVQEVLSGGKVGLREYTAVRKDKTTFYAMVRATPILRDRRPVGMRGFVIDISEKRNMEEQLTRAQKMEAIGTLAGGIAHDFNNLLMGILGNVSLLLMKMDDSHPFHDRLKNMEDYVQRGSDLTKQLLGFARGGKYEVRPTHLGEFLRRSSEMFGRTKKEVRIHSKVSDGLWNVEVDRGQMEQVCLNLFVNAWQAMPGGGDLYLSVENVDLDATDVSPHGLRPGRYVKVTVTDTGVGMDEATRARIFEPFFTTKDRGRGTGLGLASVYGIIKNHGGFIRVESEKGFGSTFMLYLPASDKAGSVEKRTTEGICRGNGTILLIDDEEMILDVGSQMLSGLGYTVLTARGGRAGIEEYQRDPRRIDLVILDIIMPDLGGNETFERLRAVDAGVKVLLSSGYSLDGQAKEIMEKGCRGFIQKPFSMEDLSRRIREIMDGQ